ncbi:MAG: radical SAM protein, partial [Lachnospiraceae bacterium]|nr:radical SAM protein [Lachnospiraceae bacterium]
MPHTQHIIKTVHKNSIAEELGITHGDILLQINAKDITDIFDYQYLVQ